MKRIQIGNDFRVSWALTQLGEAFNLVGKTYDIEVSSPYGIILVSDVVAENNILSFGIPASQQVYLGNYDITLKITDEAGQKWRLKQCDAFALVPCDCGEIVEVVQFASGIVYPANGLDAYQLAVVSGEYTGDYDGYQRWLARYAENTANDAVNIANEAKGNASTALFTAQQASLVANDAKTAIATKQDTLTLTVKDNGNIVIGNIQGQTKEFMPATPSGDPNHYMYEACGAVWNGDIGYWELNGLTDLTNEDIRTCYTECNMITSPLVTQAKYTNRNFRTNFYLSVGEIAASMGGQTWANAFKGCKKMEVLNVGNSYLATGNCVSAFSGCNTLKKIIGVLRMNNNVQLSYIFHSCKNLEEIYIERLGTNISFDSCINFKKKCLLYIIENSRSENFSITLQPDVYAWASVDEDIQAALAVKTNITLQSA